MKRIQTTMDEYVYTGDDEVLSGEEQLEEGEVFKEKDFNKKIVIEERKKRVQLMLDSINTKEKTLVFCASIAHAEWLGFN